MPRYYFHVRVADEFQEDLDGIEFDSPETARYQAELGARDSLAEKLRFGQPIVAEQIEVVDEQGELLYTLRMEDLLKSPPQ